MDEERYTPRDEESEEKCAEGAFGEELCKEGAQKSPKVATQNEVENARYAQARRKREAETNAYSGTQTPEMGEEAVQAPETDNLWTEEALQKIRDAVFTADTEYNATKQQLAEYQMREQRGIFDGDLREIHDRYPDECAKSIDELGEQYTRLCANGIPPVLAYEAVRNVKLHSEKAPLSMGDVQSMSAREKSYFSHAEVDKMTKQQIKQNYDVIRNSMSQW